MCIICTNNFCHFFLSIESLCKESQQVQLKFMLFFAVYVTMASSSTRQVFLKTIRADATFNFACVHGPITNLEFCARSLRHLKNDDYQNGLADFLCKAIHLQKLIYKTCRIYYCRLLLMIVSVRVLLYLLLINFHIWPC